MFCSYKFKLKCVELYRQSILTDIPKGIKTDNFKKTMGKWSRILEKVVVDGLKHLNQSKQ